MLQTATPASRAAARSTLSTPVAVSATSRSCRFARIVAPSITDLLARTASNPAIRPGTSACALWSWITMPGSARSSGTGSRSPLLTVPKSRKTARTRGRSGRFVEQPVDERGHLAHLLLVVLARSRPHETGVDLAHDALAVDHEERGVGPEPVELRELLEHVIVGDGAGHQHRVVDVELVREVARRLRRAFEIRGSLEHELDDLEAPRAAGREQRLQEFGLVVAVRAPAAADRDQHDLAGMALVRVALRLAVEVGEGELEAIDAGLEGRARGRVVELRRRVAAAAERFLRTAAGELLAGEDAVAAEAREVEIRRAAVEARQEQRIAARFPGDVAVVAALAQHRARHHVALLHELGDTRALAAVRVAERQCPASREVERRGVGLRKEAPGLAGHGDEPKLADDAARSQDVEEALEAPVPERRLDPVLVARHPDRELAVLETRVRRAHPFRSVDQVGDESVVLAPELEPEGQVAAVGRSHRAIQAERRFVRRGAGREQHEHGEQGCCAPHNVEAGRGKPSGPARQGSQARATRPTAISDLRGARRIFVSSMLAGSRLAVSAPASCSMRFRSSSRSAPSDSRLSPARSTSPRSLNTRPAERAADPARVVAVPRPPKIAPSTEVPIEIAVSSLRWLYCDFSRSTLSAARRSRPSSDFSLAACFSRSFATSRSRCSRSDWARRARKSPSLSPGFEVSFSDFAVKSSAAPLLYRCGASDLPHSA